MKPSLLALLLGAALALPVTASAQSARPDPNRDLLAHRDRVADATVTLPERSCAGAIAHSRSQVVTAAHCVPEDVTDVDVELQDGEILDATIEHLDRDQDLALLRLPKEVEVEPLELSDETPRKGTRLLFVGRVDRPSRTQVLRIDRLARCPSLPNLESALFTSVHAKPGDSGAPLVDQSSRIVGLIHGGARCHIAAPTAPLAKIAAGSAPVAAAAGAAPSPSAPNPAGLSLPDTMRFGPFLWERTNDGFKLRFSFKWEWPPPSNAAVNKP
jgi:S1-C subfamily serine protease